MQALVEVLQGPFAADGVAEEHGDKVDHLIAPEAPPGKAHLFGYGIEDSLSAKIVDDECGLPKPAGRRGHGLRRRLDSDRRIGDTGHWASLSRE